MPTTTHTPPPYPAYQHAGLPWLDAVPAHWELVRAKWLFQKMDRPVRDSDEVVTCFRDGTVTLRKNRREMGFTESLKEIGYQGIRRGDLVIHAMDAFAGAIGVSDSDGKGTPVYSVCNPGPKANAHYYAHLLREMARNKWIQALAKGIRERSSDFRFKEFGDQLVPLPPPAEQAAIVRYLNAADAQLRQRRDARRRLLALRREEKQALIHHAVTQGLQPNAPTRPAALPYLPAIPAHWEVRRLAACMHKLQSGMREQGNATPDDGIPNLGGEHISADSQLNLNNMRYVSRPFFEKLQRGIIQKDDILLVKDGATIGKTAMVREMPYAECSINEHVYIIRSTPVLSQSLLYYNIRAPGVQDAIWQQVTGSAQPGLNSSFAKAIYIAVPPPDEQAAIVAYLEGEMGRIDAAMARDRRLAELYDEYRIRLIADAVTGRLDLRQAPEPASLIPPAMAAP